MELPDPAFLLSPWILALLGLCVGSFLNVVIHRLPLTLARDWWGDAASQLSDRAGHERVFGHPPPATVVEAGEHIERSLAELSPLSLSKPRSRCPSCGHQIRWHENVPVLSWAWLKGRCASCKTRISARYPFFELLTGALFFAIGMRFGPQPTVLVWCAAAAVLVALAGIDWDTTFLPDNLTLPLLWGGLLCAVLGWTLPLSQAVWGAIVGYLSLWTVYQAHKAITHDEGMGHGDFKLLGALGAWLGWQMILPIVLSASLIGILVYFGMKMSNRLHEGRYVPFGPLLAGGGIAVMLAGQQRVLSWMHWA